MGETVSGNVFADASLLLGLGMITIFSILLLVVLIGRGLILVVNRYMPPSSPVLGEQEKSSEEGFSAQTLAAIVGTVEFVTGKKGRITNIEKIE